MLKIKTFEQRRYQKLKTNLKDIVAKQRQLKKTIKLLKNNKDLCGTKYCNEQIKKLIQHMRRETIKNKDKITILHNEIEKLSHKKRKKRVYFGKHNFKISESKYKKIACLELEPLENEELFFPEILSFITPVKEGFNYFLIKNPLNDNLKKINKENIYWYYSKENNKITKEEIELKINNFLKSNEYLIFLQKEEVEKDLDQQRIQLQSKINQLNMAIFELKKSNLVNFAKAKKMYAQRVFSN